MAVNFPQLHLLCPTEDRHSGSRSSTGSSAVVCDFSNRDSLYADFFSNDGSGSRAIGGCCCLSICVRDLIDGWRSSSILVGCAIANSGGFRKILVLYPIFDWALCQLDVNNAFLNGHLSETVYMKQPPGYEDPTRPDHVCHLQRSLYRLKQAPRAWFKRLHEFLLSAGFVASKTDVSLFHYTIGNSHVFLLVYVDDILMMGNDSSLVTTLLHKLYTTFKIWDLGTPSFFLGIETLHTGSGLVLSQQRYMKDILTRAGMSDCKPLATPAAVTQPATPSMDPMDNPTQYRRIVGALQYLTITRLDMSYAVNRFMHSPTEEHWCILKQVLRYIKGTQDYGLRLTASASSDIHAFSDSDWAGCPIDRKSTSGYAVFLGTNLVSWLSRKQRTVAHSSIEAEYKGLADVSAEVTWVVSLLRELGLHSGLTTSGLLI
ncbi:PREDICTED: uncharacterized protein LOC109147811 [Ipomoea nil]|uniref:uncharacterized protein LOC109147811 n=1 Tax=Ipomoea nil TaxID=35883 RepID=UPI000900DC32|nr:PREDICTED: uncharacterized protein LOC109147811 [Ipomoea nil]